MDSEMLYIVLLLTLIIFISVTIGFFIGRQSARSKFNQELDAAYRKGLAESQAEKLQVSRELRDKLLDIRGSILQSAKAYEEVLDTVDRHFPEALTSSQLVVEQQLPTQLLVAFDSDSNENISSPETSLDDTPVDSGRTSAEDSGNSDTNDESGEAGDDQLSEVKAQAVG